MQEPEVEDESPVETATASEPAPVAEVSPKEPNAAPVVEEPRREMPNKAPSVSPNEAKSPRAEVSPNEANCVPKGLAEGWLDGPNASDADWFGLSKWPGAAPSGLFPRPDGVLI
jgi:hypothetical protein